jgi:hypothetical protein
MTTISRRSLLSGLGGAGALLPLLDARRGWAQPTYPKRLLVIVWCNGVMPAHFWPQGGETDFRISDAETSPLRPLIPHRNDILVLGGMELKNLKDDMAPGGHASFPYLLTGVTGQPITVPINPDGWKKSAGDRSVDQFIADEIARTTKLPIHSLQLQATNQGPSGGRYVSFRGAPVGGLPNGPTPIDDPVKLYTKLFGEAAGGKVPDATLTRVLAERRSVLDYVGRSLERMKGRLGAEDRQKLEAHLTGVREIETTLSAGDKGRGGCSPPAPPAPGKDYRSGGPNPNYPEILKLQMDMLVSAFACDLTRVASTMWSSAHNNGLTFFWLGQEFYEGPRDKNNGGYLGPYRHHHEIAHNAERSAEHTRKKNLVDQWFVAQLAYLLDRMKQVKEGDGTMLDNTLVFFANNMGIGSRHTTYDMPWILAGRAGGAVKTGRLLRWAGGTPNQNVPHNGLLAAMCGAMGFPRETYGDPAYGTVFERLRG